MPPRCKPDLHSSDILHHVDWWLVTDVSGQAIGSIFMCHAVCLDCLTLEDEIDRFRTVGNYLQSTQHKIPEEWISQCCFNCRYHGVANEMKRLRFEVGIGKETFVVFLKLMSRLLFLDLEILRKIWEQIANTVCRDSNCVSRYVRVLNVTFMSVHGVVPSYLRMRNLKFSWLCR